MSDQPTLDGLTADQIYDLCVETATVRLQSDGTAHGMNHDEMEAFRLGACEGALSLYEELNARGLIVGRP